MAKMPLIEDTLFGRIDKVKIAIERLKTFEPPEGYYLAFSGGKDSQCIYHLAEMAEVKFDSHMNLTSVDPPEVIRFVRQYYPLVKLHRPERTMWQLIKKWKILPTRGARYCCSELKEKGGHERRVMTGIRWAESLQRSKRSMTEHCLKDKSKTYIHPIIDWEDEDVWEFIRLKEIPYCKLYDEGFKRIGCLFCPMDGKHRIEEAKRYPGYVKVFIKAFEKMYQNKKEKGLTSCDRWKDGEEMFWWWLCENREKQQKDQYFMFD